MRTLFLSLLVMAGVCQNSRADVDIYGYSALRLGTVESTRSWLDGGFGRFDEGADDAGSRDEFATAEVHVALDWSLNDDWLIHVQATARGEDAYSSTDPVGLVEAYVRWQALDTQSHSLAFSLGQKFFPSSLENTLDLWQSPYTLTFSAWNSWIAHEFRPIGLETTYTYTFADGSRLRARGSLFGGNDSSGAELAWGGWRFSQRLSVLGEVLPLPPISALNDDGIFSDQRDDGSKPFGPDLDDDLGFAAQIGYDNRFFLIRHTYVDNNGDRGLHRGEYAWRTEFNLTGAEWRPTEQLTFVAEFADGSTAMGGSLGQVDVDFSALYLLGSWQTGNHRVSVRFDDFDIDDDDGFPNDNSEDGDGWTIAYFYSPGSWRFGFEYSEINVSRPAAFESGFDPDNDGRRLTFEIRYIF